MNPNITYHIRFPTRVGVLNAASPPESEPSRWSPRPLPPDLPAPSGIPTRPTVSIIRGR